MWNVAKQIFLQDSSAKMRHILSKILLPVCFGSDNVERLLLQDFLDFFPKFVEIPPEDLDEIDSNYGLFFTTNFTMRPWASSGLRSNVLYLARTICSVLEAGEWVSLVSQMGITEPHVRLLSVIVHNRLDSERRPCDECSAGAVYSCFTNFIKRTNECDLDIVDITSLLCFVAKAVPLVRNNPDILRLIYNYAVNLLNLHPLSTMAALKILKEFQRLGVQLSEDLLDVFLPIIPITVTPHVFTVLNRMAEANPKVYFAIVKHIPNIVCVIVNEIGDGQDDWRGTCCYAALKLLKKVVQACGEGMYGEMVAEMIVRNFALLPEGQNTVLAIARIMIERESEYSQVLLRFMVDLCSTNLDGLVFIQNMMPCFLDVMRQQPTGYMESGIGVEAFDLFNHLLQQKVILDKCDQFCAVMIVCWSLHLFGNHLSVEKAEVTLGILLSEDSEEEMESFDEWVTLFYQNNLLASIVIAKPVSVSEETLEKWIRFVMVRCLPCQTYVNLYYCAFLKIIERRHMEDWLRPVVREIEESPQSFVSETFTPCEPKFRYVKLFKFIPASPIYR
jgi:hypothetical protein